MNPRIALLLILMGPLSSGAQSLSVPMPEVAKEAAPATEAATSAADATSAGKGTSGAERIEVTGSHIKRIDVEGPSPVQTLTRSDLEKTGYNSVSDVLRDTTANSFGSTREASGSNSAGVAEISLRGLGASNTLVLLNGQRLPSDAVTGSVDLNLIPMAAVERVEILKDGASAIYGSDALGGVVNIITRKDFSGSSAGFTQSVPQLTGGKKQEFSLINGINRKNLNMVNVVQYRDNETIFSRDRDWTNKGFSTIGSPGSYRNANGNWVADANCPPGAIQHTPQGDFCTFKYSDYSTQLPALQQLSLLSETNYQLNGRVKLKARFGGTQKKVQWSFAPAPGTFTVPGSVADHLGPGGGPLPGVTPGQDVQVRYRLTDLGTRDTEVETNSFNILVGSTVDLGNDFELEASASHNMVDSKDKGVNGYALTKQLTDAIESGHFNPFAPAGQKGSIDGTRYNPLEHSTSQLSSADIKASGKLGELGGGPIGVAVGSTFIFQKFADRFDEKSVNNEVFGNAGSSGGGQRDIQAVYTEFSLPISEKLEAQIAGRYDHYSDFGSTANPKAALLYHASPSVLLRSSVGTGFKAPLMQDLYAASSNGFPTFIDHVSCDRERKAGGATPSCSPQQYQVTSSGNKGLREEKSISANVGAMYQPDRDFSIGTDLFLTRLNNVVGIDYDDAMRAEAAGIDLASQGVIVHRDGNGYIDSIEAPLQNLSAQQISGIDLSTSARLGKIRLGDEHSQLFYFKEQGFPGTGLKNKLGKNGRPAWRNAASIAIMPADHHDVTFTALTTASQEKTVVEMGRIPAYTSFDVQYNYKSKKLGTITAGIKNLLGTMPPLDDSNPNNPLDTTIYDQIGRQYYTGYTATF